MNKGIKRINPEGLMSNPVFSQVVVTEGPGKTIYVGGQNAVDETKAVIGKGDLKKQTEQVFNNIELALKGAGASLSDVIKISMRIVQGPDPHGAFDVFIERMGNLPNPPAKSVLLVSGLANPEFLIEIDTIAYLPE